MKNLFEYLENGGEVGIGMMITEGNGKQVAIPSFTYQIVSKGSYVLGLICQPSGASCPEADIVVSEIGNINKKDIVHMLKYKCMTPSSEIEEDRFYLLEPSDIANFYERCRRSHLFASMT